MNKRQRLFALLGLAAVAAGSAIAYASIPGANGTITGCYDKHGDLRLIDAEAGKKCGKKETAISWNQQGPPGETGPFAYARYTGTQVDPQFSSAGIAISPGPGPQGVDYECVYLDFVPRRVTVTTGGTNSGNAISVELTRTRIEQLCPSQASAFVYSGASKEYYIQFWG